MSSIAEFFKELQRRSVIRAAIVHVLFFWLLVQVADVVLPYIGIVDDPVRWAILAGVGVFPVTLIVAWFFEHPWTHVTRGRVATDIILILLIGIGATTWVLHNLPQVVHARTSIVVLPFEHSGTDNEASISRALAIGVNSLLMQSKSIETRDIETALSPRLHGLNAPDIAGRLDVRHVLAGTISSSGDSLRIDMRLVDHVGTALWDSVIEDDVENLFSIQENIAVSVQNLLGYGDDTVPVAEIAASRCWMPNDPGAIEKYYTARYYTELRTDTDEARGKLRDAIRFFRELIDEYPEFAEAYSGLAWALGYQKTYDPRNAADDWQAEGQTLAETALQHCATLGEAMHLVSNEYDHENHWIGTHQQLTAFIEMEPHRTENRQRLARHYRDTGLDDRALEVSRRNYELNPLSVRSIKEYASVLQGAGRLDEAAQLYDLAAELGSTSPNFARMMQKLRSCKAGDLDCFINNLPGDFDQLKEPFRRIYAVPANEDEARESIEAANGLLEQIPFLINWFRGTSCRFEHLTPLFFDTVAFAKQRGLMNSVWFWPNVWGPECASAWADPRFPEFVEEFGLVEYWREVDWPKACRPAGDSFTCGFD